jgi:hypothetical protein
MVEEMESLHKNETWDLVELPNGRNLIGRKWVFKKKMSNIGQVERLKARLVEKGYSQVKVIQLDEIFSSVAKLNSIRVLMSVACSILSRNRTNGCKYIIPTWRHRRRNLHETY